MTEGQEANKEGDDHTFNGAVATLERIHVLIQFISIYRVNEHILGYKMNLYELLVEVQGFLTKDELKHAWAWWQEIDQYTIVKDEENDKIVYDSGLWGDLDHFSAWLRLRCHIHKVTFTDKTMQEIGLQKVRRRYGL
jgi:glucose-6-phosphate 1-dehydrogenase